jgi:hypothetical protein
MTTTITDLDDFKALDPFFRIIEKGLDGIADGRHVVGRKAPSPISTALTER